MENLVGISGKDKVTAVSQKLIDVLFKEKLNYQEATQVISILNQSVSAKLSEIIKDKFINE